MIKGNCISCEWIGEDRVWHAGEKQEVDESEGRRRGRQEKKKSR